MKIGVLADCFRCPLPEAFQKASALGLSGVQVFATTGEFSPALLKNRASLDTYLTLLKKLRLTISALCGDMGGHGFEIGKDNAERVARFLFYLQ